MPEIGARKNVTADELDALISTFAPTSIAMLEKYYRSNEAEKTEVFSYISNPTAGKPSAWDKGRVFDKEKEMQWEREGFRFHVVWTADHGTIPNDWEKENIKKTAERRIVLWGEAVRGEDKWYEKQVPKKLGYPVMTQKGRVYVIVQEYTFESDDSYVYRFTEVISE